MTQVPSSSHGSGLQAQTVSVTTDANTFLATTTIDLGKVVSTVAWTQTLTALTPDSEVFGTGAGQINVRDENAAGFGPTFISPDNVTFYDGPTAYVSWAGSSPGVAVNDVERGMGVSVRYLKFALAIYSQDTSNVYAGVHHPRATVLIEVAYL